MEVETPPPVREVESEEMSYDIIPILQTPNVDPGESIKIGVYVSGYGKIPRSKLSVFHGQPELIDSESPGEAFYAIGGNLDVEKNEIYEMVGEKKLKQSNLSKSGVTIGLAQANFVDDAKWGPPQETMSDLRAQLIPRIMGEGTYEGAAPVEFEFNTLDDATPGDYKIWFVLTCLSDGEIEQSQAELQVHINNRREQWEPIPTIAGIITVIIALLSLILQAGLPGNIL